MDIFILGLTASLTLLLGLLVYVRDAKKGYARSFGLMCLMITAWIFANYVTNHYTANLATTDLANRLAYFTGYGVVLAGLLFSYYFPEIKKPSHREKWTIISLGVTTLVLSLTHSVAGEVSLDEQGKLAFSIAPFLWTYILMFVVTVGVLARNLLQATRKQDRTKHGQAKLILVAFCTSALLGLTLNVIIPFFGVEWTTTRLGPLVTVIMVAIIGYTIVRHGLFDIRFAIVRTVAYVLSIATLGLVYSLAAYTISNFLLRDHSTAIAQNPLNIGLALVLVLLFQPIKQFFDRLTNRIFYQSNYSIDEFIVRVSRKLTNSNDLQVLLEQAAADISDTLKTEQAFFFIRANSGRHISAGTVNHKNMPVSVVERLDAFFLRSAKEIYIVDTNDGYADDIQKLLTSRRVRVVLPLWQKNSLDGYLFLGEKRTNYYVERDLRALRAIRDELIIAIQNALSIQEIRDLNTHLQQRINAATGELRRSNSKLRQLDEAKDEFVSMASHQLRTPLTSVKGYIDMVLQGDAGKITPMQTQLLSEAFESSERMVHLINDFLNVSRLQTGKFIIDARTVDLAKLVDQEVDSLKTTAKTHDLRLQYRAPRAHPQLMLDEGKIRQVIMNFIDNAIYYSRPSTTIHVILEQQGSDIVLEVRDTGIGVPASEQKHLFGKFFRATNARKQRPDGTGVGLFLAKRVIDAHHGQVIFHSKEGEGSTFGFRLPLTKLRAKTADDRHDTTDQ